MQCDLSQTLPVDDGGSKLVEVVKEEKMPI